MRETTRRRLLRRGVAATGAAGALAGCIGSIGGRSGPSFEGVEAPEPGPPDYRRWLPAPSALPGDEASVVGWYASPSQIADLGGAVPESFTQHLSFGKLRMDYLGVGFEGYDWLYAHGPGVVVSAPFDRTTVVDAVAGTGYQPAGEYRGFDLFERSDDPRGVAVGDGTLVWARGIPRGSGAAPTDVLRPYVDAGDGRVDRYHETDRAFDSLSGAVGAPPVGWLRPDPESGFPTGEGGQTLEGVVAGAPTWDFDDRYTYTRYVLAFEDELDPEVRAQKVRNVIGDSSRFQRFDALGVHARERTAWVVARMSDGAYAGRYGTERAAAYPQVTWGYDHDPDANEVTVTHEAGDAVPADLLRVTVDREPADPPVSERYDRITAGDSLTVGVPASGDSQVRITWVSDTGQRWAVVGSYEPGEDGAR